MTEPSAAETAGRRADAALYPPRAEPLSEAVSLPRLALRLIDNPISVWPADIFEKPLAVTRMGTTESVWLADPAHVKRVLLDEREQFPRTALENRILGPLLGKGLLTADGADWKWQRQIVAPLFRHHDLLDFVPLMRGAADAFVAECLQGPPGVMRRIDRDMAGVTFRIISDTMLPGGEAFVAEAFEAAAGDYLQPISWEVAYAVFGLPRWLPHPGTFRMRRIEREMRAAIAALLSSRRRDRSRRDDLLDRLLAARHPETGEPMSDDLLIDNLLTFLSAGHATTAMALTWTLYLLARAPEWEARVLAELDEVLGDRPVEADDMDRLVETGKVLKEALRLYPPAPIIMRQAREDTRFGDTPVRAGSHVVVPIYAIHRHRMFWDDPDRFDPERFTPEREAARTRYQFMPFGAGPRICIGQAFAMIEAMVVLATVIRALRFAAPAGAHPVPISRVTLRPKGGMALKVGARAA
ncbi:MAG: cytochrome P450 [Hyphomicrobiaceae bacterium]